MLPTGPAGWRQLGLLALLAVAALLLALRYAPDEGPPTSAAPPDDGRAGVVARAG